MPRDLRPSRPDVSRTPRPRRALAAAALTALATSLAGCDVFDEVRPGATSLFDLFALPSPSEAAEMAIDPYDSDRRYRGTMLLANAYFAGQEVYIRLFEDAARDTDARVRLAGTRALANHGSTRHAAILIERLTDSEPLVRLEAARGLQRLHSADAIEPLMNASRNPDLSTPEQRNEENPEIRSEAAHALGQYRTSEVVQHLISILNDSQLSVNRGALASLRTLTGQDFGFDRRAWLDWYNETEDLFVAGTPYVYPVFQRDKTLLEYLPFVSPPPNEVASTPAGMPPITGGTLVPLSSPSGTTAPTERPGASENR